LLDHLLSPRDPNQLAVLQWALKTCAQEAHEVSLAASEPSYPMLACEPAQGKKNRVQQRGDTPEIHTTLPTSWLVAGAELADKSRNLPADPAKPLDALVEAVAFRQLSRMGLIRHWRGLWIPRGRAVLEYADELFPTRVEYGKSGWEWKAEGWKGAAMEQARRVLFGGWRDREAALKPYEGFDFSDWEKLREFIRRNKPHPGFFELLGLPDAKAYQEIQDGQQSWKQLIHGHRAAWPLLLKRLQSHKIEITLALHEIEPAGAWLAGLTLPGADSRFKRIWMVFLEESLQQQWREQEEDDLVFRLADLSRRIRQGARGEWQQAIAMFVFDLPQRLRRRGELAEQDAVWLDSRQLNRLMGSRENLARVAQEIAQSQLPLGELAQNVFKAGGPVGFQQFFGRAGIVKRVSEGLRIGKSYVITGSRSIGKSSLLHFMRSPKIWQNPLDKKFLPVFLDAQAERQGGNYGRFLRGLMQKTDITLAEPLLQELTRLQADLEKNSGETIYVDLSLRDKIQRLATEILDEIDHAAYPKIPLYLIDEADGLYQYDAAWGEPLFTLFRARHNAGLAGFLFASYPPQAESMAGMIQDTRRQAYNFVEMEVLGPLEPEEGGELVRSGMRRLAVSISPEQERFLVEQTFAIPKLLQQACLDLCKKLQAQIERGDGNEITPDLLKSVVLPAQKGYLEVEFFGQFDPYDSRFAFISLILGNKYAFSLAEAVLAFKLHAGLHWSAEQARDFLRKLQRTLILSSDEINRYYFSGPPGRPYFPTLLLEVYGKEKLENMILAE
jgi:hypothetical protein